MPGTGTLPRTPYHARISNQEDVHSIWCEIVQEKNKVLKNMSALQLSMLKANKSRLIGTMEDQRRSVIVDSGASQHIVDAFTLSAKEKRTLHILIKVYMMNTAGGKV